MLAYIIETQNSKFAYISFREFDQSEPGAKLNTLYIFIL